MEQVQRLKLGGVVILAEYRPGSREELELLVVVLMVAALALLIIECLTGDKE